MTTTRSTVPFGTHWQLSRDWGVRAGASSSMSSSSSVAFEQEESPCSTYTWQVEQAHTPPHEWLISTPASVAMSSRLPSWPSWPNGNVAGSTGTSVFWPVSSSTNVTLNGLTAFAAWTFSMYGLTPAMGVSFGVPSGNLMVGIPPPAVRLRLTATSPLRGEVAAQRRVGGPQRNQIPLLPPVLAGLGTGWGPVGIVGAPAQQMRKPRDKCPGAFRFHHPDPAQGCFGKVSSLRISRTPGVSRTMPTIIRASSSSLTAPRRVTLFPST